MAGDLLHIRVGKGLKQEIQKLLDEGIFENQTEVAREAIRDLILKYKKMQNNERKD